MGGRSRMRLHEAEQEAADHRSIFCESCPAVAQEDKRHCLSCELYWEDVRAGMFDRDDDDIGPRLFWEQASEADATRAALKENDNGI